MIQIFFFSEKAGMINIKLNSGTSKLKKKQGINNNNDFIYWAVNLFSHTKPVDKHRSTTFRLSNYLGEED